MSIIISYLGNGDYMIGKEEGHMVNLDGSPVQVKSLNFTMQGRTKLSDTRGIGIQLRGFALGV